jgi:ATP-dependent Lon protease
LLGYWDVVAFDEFAGREKRANKALVDIMKNYMANKSFSRGVESLSAEASMVFVGNTSHTVPYMLKHSDLFEELPAAYHDSAFLDRLHHYIPGWEIDIIRSEMFSDGYGFVVDYIAEILRSLRSQDFSDRYQQYFTLSADISTRDRDGIHKTFSGLMKILYPHGEVTVQEVEELLRLSIEGRKRVKDQILRIDRTIGPARFGYSDVAGAWHGVTTLEEDEYPGYYHQAVGGDPEEETDRPDKDGVGVATVEATPSALKPCHRVFQENQRGVSYGKIIVPYVAGANEIVITDPYIRVFRQIRNLMELIESIAMAKAPGDEISIILHTIEHPEPDKADVQRQKLVAIQAAAGSMGIAFEVKFDETRTIHDRYIVTDTGWKIILGRGLDIFQYFSNDTFDPATRVQEFRQVKEFGVTYVRSN